MDPLSQLKDIHLPENIHHYPVALGWWILVIMLISSLIWALICYKKYRQKRWAKKQALKMITAAQNNSELLSCLKWVCLQYFPRENVAPLYGADFQLFLKNQLAEKYRDPFSQATLDNMINPYQKDIQPLSIELKQAASLFITKALPPQKVKESKSTSPIKAGENTHV